MKRIWILALMVSGGISLYSRPQIKIGPYYGIYIPKSELIREIYSDKGNIYGFHVGVTVWNGFSIWGAYSQYRVISRTTFLEENTTLALNPVSLSVRYTPPITFFVLPFVTLGYTWIDFKEESVVGKVRGRGGSYSYGAGIEIQTISHVSLAFEVQQSRIKVSPTGFPVDVGGLRAGGALLIRF